MIVAGKFSFNGGDAAIQARYPHLLPEIEKVIAAVKAEEHKTKESIEKTMLGRMLYSPSSLNRAFKEALNAMDWSRLRAIKSAFSTKVPFERWILSKRSWGSRYNSAGMRLWFT